MVSQSTPTDKLYSKGVPLDTERIIQHADISVSSPVAGGIDWDGGVEMDDDTRFAVMAAVSHYHYVKTSNVLLCDELLSKTDLPDPIRCATKLLLKRNAEELQTWSKYVEQGKQCGPMGSAQQEYYRVIWNQDGILPVLFGIQHINLAADTSYGQFQADEPLFQQITAELVKHNDAVYQDVNDAFRDILAEKSHRQRLAILRQIAQQIDLLQIIARERSNEDIFNVLDTSDARLVYGTGKRIKEFYGEIGLTEGLLPDLSL